MKLNKRKKGLAALVTGAALLAGTAGTFALWYDTTALGATADEVRTGNLALATDRTGHWTWDKVSHLNHVDLLNQTFTATSTDHLVPGDALRYTWTSGDSALLLSGNTLEANLYIDGVLVNPTAIYPLVLKVNTVPVNPTLVNGVYTYQINAQLLNQTTPGTLPAITLGFPALDTPVAPGDPNPSGNAGSGYGRNMGPLSTGQIANLQIRLQQVVSGTYEGS